MRSRIVSRSVSGALALLLFGTLAAPVLARGGGMLGGGGGLASMNRQCRRMVHAQMCPGNKCTGTKDEREAAVQKCVENHGTM